MMRACSIDVLIAVVVLLVPVAAAAQEKGQTGVSIEYPATIGVIHHVSDRLAIRPEVSFITTSGDSASNSTSAAFASIFTSTRDAWDLGVGVSALFYVGKWEALRTYVSPKFLYTRGTSTATFSTSSSLGSTLNGSTTIDDSSYGVAGSFGAQYTLGRRFSILGEAGVGYSRLKLSEKVADQTISTTNTFGTRARVGVVLYF
jgi:hypothetical protein